MRKRFLLPPLIALGLFITVAAFLLSGLLNPSNAGTTPPETAQPAKAAVTADPPVADAVTEVVQWLKSDFSLEQRLMAGIRRCLVSGEPLSVPSGLDFPFDPEISVVMVALFHEGREPLRWISRRDTLSDTLNRVVDSLRKKADFAAYEVADPKRCRILLEVVTSQAPLDVRSLALDRLDAHRFEPGVTGLRVDYAGTTQFFMPTDASTYGYMGVADVLNHLSKKVGVAKQTNRISERAVLMKMLDAQYFTIKSMAFVTWGDDVLPLYRGYPVPVDHSPAALADAIDRSVAWVYENMMPDGRFLYYYEGVRDTVIDHVHPDRTLENNYYNILRHSGGIVTLLRAYERDPDRRYLTASDKALEFLTKHIRSHSFDGRKAFYVFYNQKAKLGGTGIGLVAFLRHRQATGETKYDEVIHGLANHLLSRVAADGEMIGYYIHPNFNDGRPLLDPSDEERKQLFSFYYPGEALMGLALYYRLMDLPANLRTQVRETARKALHWLVKVRPVEYADLFEPLPSDGWLMQAIEEWTDVPEFRDPSCWDFVFGDARQLIDHMYNPTNALYYDYPGGFFYQYGDHAYIDGARAEGLISAYYLARKLGRNDLAADLLKNCRAVAANLMFAYNSPESTYMYKHPDKALGSFRFKYTRHWVRVDTAQHTACFFVRLLQALETTD